MTTHRALTLTVALGLLLPCMATQAAANVPAAALRSSAVSVDQARSQLVALQRAGIRTHGALAEASSRDVARLLGRSRARVLQSAARRHVGPEGLLDPNTELDVVSIIDPQFIPAPRYKENASAERKLEAARREMRALADLHVASYGDLLRIERRRLAATVGRARARAMVNTVQSLQRLVGAAEGSVAIIDPQFLEARFDAAFVADPTMVSNIESPLLKVGANPTPHP